ncbi:hypothetical protein EVJ50_12035 [Synechococcus sp. RSCCF101]|nr:hypothetical protein EVJ50_12035 [Synechococcus sp. RSCCF101]
MAETVFLHLGLHKAASSSFQATCAQNSDLLRTQAICYPPFRHPSCPDRILENHSLPLHSLFAERPEQHHINIQCGIADCTQINDVNMQILKDALYGSRVVLLSAEDVCDLSQKDMRHLRLFLSGRCRRLIPFALVRSPYALHCSALAAMVVHGGRRMDAARPLLSQRWKIERLMKVFGSAIRWFSFAEACCASGGACGIPAVFSGVGSRPILHRSCQ